MGSTYYNGDTYHSPSIKSHTSIYRDIQESVLPAAELCDHCGHNCVLLCKRHSEGTALSAQTQATLQGLHDHQGACGTHQAQG